MPKFIAKCTPSLGRVSLWWSRCAETLFWPAGFGKTLLYLQDRKGGEIAECRNEIVENALEFDRTQNPCPYLFWLDDDVLVFPGALMELLNLGADIATGTYFLKLPHPAAQPLLWPGPEFTDGGMIPFTPDRILPVAYHGMGLTLVKLDVYKRMAAELDLPRDKYGRPSWYRTSGAEDITTGPGGMIELGYTEDTWFLRHAQKLGYKSVASTSKHAFGFHTSILYQCECGFETTEESLLRRHRIDNPKHLHSEGIVGYPEPQWRQWIAGESIRWPTPTGEITWN